VRNGDGDADDGGGVGAIELPLWHTQVRPIRFDFANH
jgi:hypothetical protein